MVPTWPSFRGGYTYLKFKNEKRPDTWAVWAWLKAEKHCRTNGGSGSSGSSSSSTYTHTHTHTHTHICLQVFVYLCPLLSVLAWALTLMRANTEIVYLPSFRWKVFHNTTHSTVMWKLANNRSVDSETRLVIQSSCVVDGEGKLKNKPPPKPKTWPSNSCSKRKDK